MIRHQILTFIHQKIFRHDAGKTPNKFTNLIYAILMPFKYYMDHNTSLRYDWNRDVYVIDGTEMTGKFIAMLKLSTKNGEKYGILYPHLSETTKGVGISRILYESYLKLGSDGCDIVKIPPLSIEIKIMEPFDNNSKFSKTPVMDTSIFSIPFILNHKKCNYDKKIELAKKHYLSTIKILTNKREETMKVNLEIAKICHKVNRDYCINEQLEAPPKWDDLPANIQESIVAGVAEVITDPKVTPTQIHQMWCDYKEKEGWKYALNKDLKLKTHPNLVLYKDLADDQKRKPVLFIQTVRREMKK